MQSLQEKKSPRAQVESEEFDAPQGKIILEGGMHGMQ